MLSSVNRGLFLLLGLVIMTSIVGCAGLETKISAISIDEIDLSKVADGEYEGEYDGGLVKARVRAVVSDHRLASLVILKHDKGLGGKAESIVDDVITAQSLAVDAVTGATFSSKVILKATEIALRRGVTETSGEGTNQ